MVGITKAAEIVGVHPTQMAGYLRPGSGAKTIWGGFGPEQTYMITPARLDDPVTGRPVWVREDVERFARDIGRKREPKGSGTTRRRTRSKPK